MVFPNTGIPPQQREGFQAVINNGKIYIFVGSESDAFGKMIIFNLNLQDSIWSLEIPMYNTLKDNWSNAKMNPTGKIIPEGRQMHSAVLSKFNTIIVYGGYYYKVSSKPELVILDISNPIYNWIQPIT
ncbi:11109_t:CDS:2, partial [Rhizophagus irregularis]